MAVKLQFKEQEFQQRAVDAVAGIFTGQAQADSIYTIRENLFEIDAQQVTVTNERILENLQTIQKKNGLPQNKALDSYEGGDFLNFTVEMETGTGKTFVYTNTILELNKLYGWKKFVIVVPPSTAIREGVINSLNATKPYFLKQYDNVSYEFFGYSGEHAQRVRSFANSSNIQIMVVTKGSFDSASNIMNKGKSKEDFRTPIEFIRDVRPVVIIDEPQSVDTQTVGKEAIASLNPCVVLRYSATHKSVYNLVYKLGPVEAHRDNLVKEIFVSSIRAHKDFNKPYIKVIDVEHGSGYKAKLEIDWRNSKGVVERKIRSINKTSDLYDVSGERDFYSEYKVSNIDARPGFQAVHFDNGTVIPLGGSVGNVDERVMKKAQIMRTIELHFENEKRLNAKGIKVLSLFFIDHVNKYRGQDDEKGDYAVWFEECYEELRGKYPELTMDGAESAHSGYFSQDKKGGYKDTRGDTKDDESTYDLIMRDKEKLLSFDSPVRFIFSHSALKEGWDNPNVFQICALLEPKTEFTRRQKIGRGLRLCVNQNGERIEDKNINQLYVISDENFAEFASGLQKKYEDDLGMTFDGITIQFLSEISSRKEFVQTSFDGELITKTIELNRATGAIDESGVIVASEKVVVPLEITDNREKVAEIIKTGEKIDETVLQAIPVKIKKTVREPIPAEILEETVEEFAKAGYLDKENKPTRSIKEALKQGVEALRLPERAEYARQEIFDFLSGKYSTPEISNADNTDKAIAKKEVIFGDPFRKLWDKIKTKTRYRISMSDDMFKTAVLLELNSSRWAYVDKVKIVYEDAEIGIKASGVQATAGTESSLQKVTASHRTPDILRSVSEQCNISKKMAYEIFAACGKDDEFLNNPQVFTEQFVEIINRVKSRMEVANIAYIPMGSSFEYAQVFDNFEDFVVNRATNAVEVNNSLYNYIKYDSEKVELRFAERIDIDKNVELFLKLPTKKYVISTPVGHYTPDWAIIKRNIHGQKQEIYFVVETKGSSDDMALRELEDIKIQCAKKHYEALGYEVIENAPLIEKDSKYVRKQNYKDFALEG
jgi:type III restriction enzyme